MTQVGHIAGRDGASLVGILGVGFIQVVGDGVVTPPVAVLQDRAPVVGQQFLQVGQQGGMEFQEGGFHSRNALHLEQCGGFQFGARTLPHFRVDLGDHQHVIFEAHTLEDSQRGQGEPGLIAQAAQRKFQRDEQAFVALFGLSAGEAGQQVLEIADQLCRGMVAQVGQHQVQRKGVPSQVVHQADQAQPRDGRPVNAQVVEDVGGQFKSIRHRQPFQRQVRAAFGGREPCIIEGRVARGDQHTAAPCAGFAGLCADSGLRPQPHRVQHRPQFVWWHERLAAQHRLEVVEDDQGRGLAQQGGDALHGIAVAEHKIGVAADSLPHPRAQLLQRAAVLKRDKGRAAGEAPHAVEPAPGFGGQRRFAQPPKAMHHHNRVIGQLALQREQFAGAAMEPVQRLGRQCAGERGIGQRARQGLRLHHGGSVRFGEYDRVLSLLVKRGQEPVLKLDVLLDKLAAGIVAGQAVTPGIGHQRAPPPVHRATHRQAIGQAAVEGFHEHTRGYYQHRVVHCQHAACPRTDQPCGDAGVGVSLFLCTALTGVQHDQRHPAIV